MTMQGWFLSPWIMAVSSCSKAAADSGVRVMSGSLCPIYLSPLGMSCHTSKPSLSHQ